MSKRARSVSVDEDERQVKWAALEETQEKLHALAQSTDFFNSTMDVAMFEREILPLLAGNAFLRDSELPENFSETVYWKNRDSQVALWAWRQVNTTWRAFCDAHRDLIQPPTLANVMEYYIAHDMFLEFAALHMTPESFQEWMGTPEGDHDDFSTWKIKIHPDCERREALEFVYRNESMKLIFAAGRRDNDYFLYENAELLTGEPDYDSSDTTPYQEVLLMGTYEDFRTNPLINPEYFAELWERYPAVRRRIYTKDDLETIRWIADKGRTIGYALDTVFLDVEDNFDCFGIKISTWLFEQTMAIPNTVRWRMLMPLLRPETMPLFDEAKFDIFHAASRNRDELIRFVAAARHHPAQPATGKFVSDLIYSKFEDTFDPVTHRIMQSSTPVVPAFARLIELVFEWTLASFRLDLFYDIIRNKTRTFLDAKAVSIANNGLPPGYGVVRPFKIAPVTKLKQITDCLPYLHSLHMDFSANSISTILFMPKVNLSAVERASYDVLRPFRSSVLVIAVEAFVSDSELIATLSDTPWHDDDTGFYLLQILFYLVECKGKSFPDLVALIDPAKIHPIIGRLIIWLTTKTQTNTIQSAESTSALCNLLVALLDKCSLDLRGHWIRQLFDFAALFSVKRRVAPFAKGGNKVYTSTGVQAVLKAIFAYIDRYNAANRIVD